ncbi:MAG: ABC transporter permease [Bacteroidales bacterium]|nr:ABC transporter permease [Bacteroidales bacterium]
MRKFILFIRHALALIHEDKLFSAIYIAGTAVAIASAMVVALILHIRISNIYPEEHRDRTVGIRGNDFEKEGKYIWRGYSPLAVEEVFDQLQCAEIVSAHIQSGYVFSFTACAGFGKQEVPVTVKFTDADFWRLYSFRFVDGRPYTDQHLKNADKQIVITDALARKVFGTTEHIVGQSLLLNFLSYQIIGIVKDASPLMRDSSADVYLPYTVSDAGQRQGIREVNYTGPLAVTILLKKGCTVQMLNDELESYRVKYLSMLKQTTGNEYEWRIRAVPYWARTLNFFSEGTTTADMLSNLSLPVLLMLLLLLLPAINLSGMVSNRMESRMAEMGIRKAFGAKRRTLLREVIRENLVLTLCGGIAGYLLSWLFVYAIRNSKFFLTFFAREYDSVNSVSLQSDMFFSPLPFLIAFVCCCAINLMAALLPARKSLRNPIVESLNQKR